MNAYIADTNKYFRHQLHQILGSEEPLSPPEFGTLSPLEIAQDIIAKLDSLDLILINSEATFGSSKRQQFAGIELLIWLRIRPWQNRFIKCPIIIYGFHSAQQILNRYPEHFIIYAPGNTYFKLPFSKEQLMDTIARLTKNEISLISDENYQTKYEPYIKPAFNIEKFRHREANWWGVKSLHDVHRIVTNQSQELFPYHHIILEQLNKIENTIANFIYSTSKKELDKEVAGEIKKIEKLREEIIAGTIPAIFYIDDKAEDGWASILLQMIYGNATLKDHNDVLNVYYVNNSPKFYCVKNIDKYNINDFTELLLDAIEKNEISIDLILLDLRLNDKEENVQKIKELSGYTLLELFRSAQKGIPIIVTSASNKIWNYEELIKIGVDAYWIKEGVDEQKSTRESVHNYISLLSTINSLTGYEYNIYKKFGNAIQKFHDEQFWWKKEVDWSLIGNKHNLDNLRIASKTTPDCENILSILDDCFILFREYLQRKILKNHYDPFNENDWVLPSLIMQHASKIVELVHDFKTHESNLNNKHVKWKNKGLTLGFTYNEVDIPNSYYHKKLFCKNSNKYKYLLFFPIRGDALGSEIFELRNIVSHTNNVQKITFLDLEDFINSLTHYLNKEPEIDMTPYKQLT